METGGNEQDSGCGSSLPGSTTDTSKTRSKEGTIEERIEEFSKTFVKICETKLSEFKKEAAVGGKAKVGSIAQNILKPVKPISRVAGGALGVGASAVTGLGLASIASGAAGDISTSTSNFFYGKYHRRKAKRVINIVALMDKDALRLALLEGATDLFKAFECQFTEATDAGGSWTRAMEKLAVDAMDRAINYMNDCENNNPNIEVKIDRDFITKCVISGESKRGTAASITSAVKLDRLSEKRLISTNVKKRIPKPGHTIRNEEGEWKIADLFKSVGVVTLNSNGNCDKYYRKRYGDKSDKYGYRLLFSWESISSYRRYIRPSKEYQYALKEIDLEKISTKILNDINKNDPEKTSGIVYSTKLAIDEMKINIEEITEICQEVSDTVGGVHGKLDDVRITGNQTLHHVHKNQIKLQEIHEGVYNISTKVDAVHKSEQKVKDLVEAANEEINIISNTTKEAQDTMHDILDILQGDYPKSSGSVEISSVYYNVLPPIASFTGREREILKIHESLREDGMTTLSQVIVISGLGGIGKTELARKYVSIYKSHYNDRFVWIHAETYHEIVESFRGLARDVLYNHISQKEEYIRDLDIKTIVKDVHRYFTGGKCLFVFDNAEKFRSRTKGDDGIDLFLPLTTEYIGKIYVVVTSRNQKWGGINVLKLDVLTNDEAANFIRSTLDLGTEVIQEEISELAEALQRLPLALQQATAYINMMNTMYETSGTKFCIKDYLQRLRKENEEILDFDFCEEVINTYTHTVFSTWKITLEKIEADVRCGEKAKEMLHIIAYFAPMDIDGRVFTKGLPSGNEAENICFALELLKQYSMINSGKDKSFFNVHRLVQQVTRIQLKRKSKDIETIYGAYRILRQYFSICHWSLEEIFTQRNLILHCEMLVSHIQTSSLNLQLKLEYVHKLSMWSIDVSSFGEEIHSKILERILELPEELDDLQDAEILDAIGEPQHDSGDTTKIRRILHRALKTKKRFCGSYSLQYAITLSKLCDTYSICEYKIIRILERILDIKERQFGNDSENLIPELKKLAHAHYRNHNMEIQIQERILKITELHQGPTHIEVYLILKRISDLYGLRRDYSKQRSLLERMLQIQENLPGGDCYIVETLLNLGKVYDELRIYDKQKEVLQKALAIRLTEYGPDHSKVFAIKCFLDYAHKKASN